MVKLLSTIHTEVLAFISFWCMTVPRVLSYWLAMLLSTTYILAIATPLYWLCGADAFYEINKILKGDENEIEGSD